MKIAQEVRAGNVIMIGSNPMVVQKAEFSKSGRNASIRTVLTTPGASAATHRS